MLTHVAVTNNTTRSQHHRRRLLRSTVAVALLTAAMASSAADSAQELEQLIARAERAIAANRLTTPAADNAVAYLERALALEPGDSRAAALLEKVVVRYERLVDKALDRGERARLQSLDRALTFRDRAKRVIAKHGLSSAALAGMDENIAALGKPTRAEQASTVVGGTDEMLKGLVDQHVALANAFLADKNVQEARWHAAQADALAGRYQMAAHGLPELQQQLAMVEERAQAEVTADASTVPESHGATRERLTELAAFYVVSEHAAMAQGDVSAAVDHRKAAEDLVTQYGLSEEEVRNVSDQLEQVQIPSPSVASRRVFGTF